MMEYIQKVYFMNPYALTLAAIGSRISILLIFRYKKLAIKEIEKYQKIRIRFFAIPIIVGQVLILILYILKPAEIAFREGVDAALATGPFLGQGFYNLYVKNNLDTDYSNQ